MVSPSAPASCAIRPKRTTSGTPVRRELRSSAILLRLTLSRGIGPTLHRPSRPHHPALRTPKVHRNSPSKPPDARGAGRLSFSLPEHAPFGRKAEQDLADGFEVDRSALAL